MTKESQETFEINEGSFLDSMRILVKKQVEQMTTIAHIQDQMEDMIREHDKRSEWAEMPLAKSLMSPYTYTVRTETFAFFMLAAFLMLQVLIQLAFMGHLEHLVPHLPEFIQNWFH